MSTKSLVAEGTKPVIRIEDDFPNCPDPRWQCSWGVTSYGRWWLKFINNGCPAHSKNYAALA